MPSAMDGGKARSDMKMTDKLERKHMRPETKSTKRAVKKAEGKKPPKEGAGSVGSSFGKDRDYSRMESGRPMKPTRPRDT